MRVQLSSFTLVVSLSVATNVLAQGNPVVPPPPPPPPSPTQVVPPPVASPPAPPLLPSAPPAPPAPPAPAATNPPPDVAPPPPPPGTALPAAPPAPPGATMQPYPYPYPGAQPYYPNGPNPYPQGAYPPGFKPNWAYPLPTKTVTRWYGWQTLIGVVASDIVAVIGLGANIEAFGYIGISGHVLTGPIVHWTHGNVGKGFASLGLNVGLPGLGFAAGFGLGGDNLGGLFLGLFVGGIGYLAAPTLDMAFLSTETEKETAAPPKGARALLPSSVSVMPMLDQNRRGLMLVGQF